MIKSLEFFYAMTSAFLVSVISYSISPICLQNTMKKALFLPFLGSLLITYLITLNLEKRNYCFGKKSGNNLNFGSKNLYRPWDIRIKKRWLSFLRMTTRLILFLLKQIQISCMC